MPHTTSNMPIYMDHNATTPIDSRVLSVMQPYLEKMFGNPSSASHAYGWQAQSAVKKARTQIAELLGCRSSDVLWTSGATESNNIALLGVIRAHCEERPHIITQATEHKAVLEVAEAARSYGAELTILPVNSMGQIKVEDVRAAIRSNTLIVSIMAANNEIGTLQPIEKIAALCQEKQIIFHTDAAQAVGKVELDLQKLPIDMLSLSGHKIYGPKGVGALIVRKINRDFNIAPLMFGGDQEHGLRPGTLNVPGIVGLGRACELAKSEFQSECQRLKELQDLMIETLSKRMPKFHLNGPREGRLVNNINFSLEGLAPDDFALGLSGIAYSSGSACTSASAKPSHVLTACGLDGRLARGTLRFGLGRLTTREDVEKVIEQVCQLKGIA